jgi:hypothetical protein
VAARVVAAAPAGGDRFVRELEKEPIEHRFGDAEILRGVCAMSVDDIRYEHAAGRQPNDEALFRILGSGLDLAALKRSWEANDSSPSLDRVVFLADGNFENLPGTGVASLTAPR